MFPDICRATLLNASGKVIEHGAASVSVKDKSVDFSCGFVPILKFGANVKIICTVHGHPTHIFSGSVFLSSPSLLRVVSVECTMLPGAENVLYIASSVAGNVIIPYSGQRRRFIKKTAHCVVTGISTQKLTFKAPRSELDLSGTFFIALKEPVFTRESKIMVKALNNGLLFGSSVRCECEIVSIGIPAVKELIEFVRDKNIETVSELLVKE